MKRVLKNIQIKNFRGFSGSTDIDLNADVVLVHGMNGAGKTTLLHAIELALTGEIGDLIKFEGDYPRCLLSEGEETLSVSLDTHLVKEPYQYHQGLDTLDQMDQQLDPSLKRHFSERCYLSQLKLSRLLDNYQESEESRVGGEQRIIRFVRELLGLDRLQCVNEGLAIARHAGSFKAEVPSVKRLQDRRDALDRQHSDLEPRERIVENNVNDLVKAISADLRKRIGLPAQVPVEREALKSELDVVSSHVRAAKKDIRDAERALDVLSELEEDYRTHAASPSEEGAEKAITKIRKDRDDTDSAIAKAISALNASLSAIAKSIENKEWRGLSTGSALFNRHGDLVDALDRSVADLRRELADLTVDDKRHDTLSKQVKKLENEDKALIPVAPHLTHVDEYVEAMTLLLQVVHGNDCPVCGRDFGELGGKRNLRAHIAEQIRRLGADADKAAKAIERQVQIQSDRKKKMAEWRLLEKSANGRKKRIDTIEKELERLGKLSERLAGSEESIQALLKQEDNLRDLKDRLQRLQAASKGIERIAAKLVAIEREYGIKEETSAPVNIKRFARVASSVRSKLKQDSERGDQLDAVSEQITDLSKFVEARNLLSTSVRKVSLDLASVKKALADIDAVRAEARKLAETAEDVRNNLLNTTLSTSLAALWIDLYVRIVKDERFAPNIGPISVDYRVTNTSLQAVGPGGVPFQYLLSVLSSGNANTAALCLFLSLNLIQISKFPVLLLDDPVQNMDDVHLVQLASVLRSIRRDARRQLVVAVHERSLFDYFSVELAPGREGERLIGIELEKVNGAIRSTVTRTDWAQDNVQIASEAMATA